MLYCRDDNNRLIVIIRIEKLYLNDVLSIKVDVFRNSCKIKKD